MIAVARTFNAMLIGCTAVTQYKPYMSAEKNKNYYAELVRVGILVLFQTLVAMLSAFHHGILC